MAPSRHSASSVARRTRRAMLAAMLVLGSVTCGTSPVPHRAGGPTAEQVVAELAERIPTATPGVVFTAESDPDHLLGQVGGYLSKAAFLDGRIDPGTATAEDGGVQRGGLVEVFADDQGAARRMSYLQELGPPYGEEYNYVSGPMLLRVANALTPWQASEYATALTEIGAPD